MKFQKIDLRSNTLFHYTTLENAKKIIEEGKMRTGNDMFCFFTESEEKARELFFRLMKQGTEYIGHDLTVHKREYCNPQEYVILKIAIRNDNQFYRFICRADGFNPYEYSVLHLGELIFENVEILPIVQKETEQSVSCVDTRTKVLKKRNSYKNGLRRTVAAGAVATILYMNTIPVYADSSESWLDPGKYDIKWYDDSKTEFNITSPEQLAGLSYLANNNETLYGKKFIIQNDIDLTAYEWVTIPKEFKGFIGVTEGLHWPLFVAADDGVHRVLVKSYQTPFVEEASDKGELLVSYAVPVSGIEDGKTYCGAVDVTGSNDSVGIVKINGDEESAPDGKFTVFPANDPQRVEVTDYGSNIVSYTVTVNDGHTWNEAAYEWAGDNSTCTATRFCTVDGCDGKETETVDSTSALTQERTCILPELTTYTATFTNPAFTMQTRENVQTAKAAGHSFSSELDSTCNVCSFSRTVPNTITKEDKNNPNTGVEAVKTGDSSSIVWWGALLMSSIAAIVTLLTKKKRQIK